jgi:hypothetical protein
MLRSPVSQAGSTRRGMIAAQIVLSMSVLMAVLAVVTDGGLLLAERRHAQATADAAALAAACDLYYNWPTNSGSDPSGTAKSSALGVASANGYTNNGTSSTVTVHIPPTAGTFINKAGYAEVIVTWNQQRGFSGVFGSGAIPVSAVAIARGVAQASTAGVLLLSPTAGPALAATGNATLNISGSVVVDSPASNSIAINGNITMTATAYDLAASAPGYSNTGNVTMNGTVLNNQTPAPDPLSSLAAPNPASLTTQSSSTLQLVGNGTATLQPGVYIGGISVIGNYTVNLQPGIYYLEGGGLSTIGNVTLTGSGVMIYNAPTTSSNTINLSGNTVVNLSPMTSGIYAGITIFQARASTALVSIVGNAGANITGTIYAASAAVDITGNTNTEIGSQYIAASLNITGNSSFSVGGTGAPVAQAHNLGLVE